MHSAHYTGYISFNCNTNPSTYRIISVAALIFWNETFWTRLQQGYLDISGLQELRSLIAYISPEYAPDDTADSEISHKVEIALIRDSRIWINSAQASWNFYSIRLREWSSRWFNQDLLSGPSASGQSKSGYIVDNIELWHGGESGLRR